MYLYLRINMYNTTVGIICIIFLYVIYAYKIFLIMRVEKITNRYFYSDERLKMFHRKNHNIHNNHIKYTFILYIIIYTRKFYI